MDLQAMGRQAQNAARILALAGTELRRRALHAMSEAIEQNSGTILKVNRIEVEAACAGGRSEGFVDRLTLTPDRIADMSTGLRAVSGLSDPLENDGETWARPNGLVIRRISVPLGVIGIIYESRPNVTADSTGLCVYAGSTCILRGGSEALKTNGTIATVLRSALREVGLPENCVQFLEDPSHDKAMEMMRLRGGIDVLIPRGGAGLINTVIENASVPVIETGAGVCHTYIDAGCTDFAMARRIAINAKCSRPSVCNAMETLLVDVTVAQAFLPLCLEELRERGVEIRGCARAKAIVPWISLASEEDWAEEYDSLILAVKVMSSMEDVLEHVHQYGTRHSECIVTQDESRAQKFLKGVDAAVVYHNASTRFTDGFEFGFGAEIGISNQKLHARGPMGLKELTTYKYIVCGSGQIR